MLNGTVKFVQNNPVKVGTYLVGLVVLLFARGIEPTKEVCAAVRARGCACARPLAICPTIAQAWDRYNAKAPGVEDVGQVWDAEAAAGKAHRDYYAHKGWFTCDAVCTQKYEAYERLRATKDALRSSLAEVQADANAELGLFSTHAVTQARDKFWSYLFTAKEGASRATSYDAVFMVFRSMGRDESLVGFLLELLLRLLLNIVLFVVFSLVGFLWSVWYIILSYRPNPAAALVFFLLCALMSWSFFVSIILAIAGSVTAAAVGVVGATRLNIQNTDRRPHQIHTD